MINSFKTLAYSVAATVILSSGVSAYADSVTMTFNTSQPNSKAVTVSWQAGDQKSVDYTSAGIYNFTVKSVDGDNPLSLTPGSTLTGVCIDLTHRVYANQTGTFTIEKFEAANIDNGVGGMNATQVAAIGYLWQTYGLTATQTGLAAEFQMAVWDILYNGYGTNLANDPTAKVTYSGTTASITTATNWAQTAATWAASHSVSDLSVAVYAMVNSDGIQSFGVAFPSSNSAPPTVPLPAGASMGIALLSSLGGFFGIRSHLRRRRAAQV